jgi:hypothetical protein
MVNPIFEKTIGSVDFAVGKSNASVKNLPRQTSSQLF